MSDPFRGWVDEHPPLTEDEVHVWGWQLCGAPGDLPALINLLSADERARKDSFRFPRDAERFLRARAGLRQLLGHYLALAPQAVCLAYGEHGKPALASGEDLQFNLSHTGAIAVAAFSRSGAVGIDVEEVHPVAPGLGESVFSPTELNALNLYRGEEHTKAFFKYWTKKEAVLKAEGRGFHMPTTGFSVSLAPDESPHATDEERVLIETWRLADLPLEGDFAGSVAFLGKARRVRWLRCVHCT